MKTSTFLAVLAAAIPALAIPASQEGAGVNATLDKRQQYYYGTVRLRVTPFISVLTPVYLGYLVLSGWCSWCLRRRVHL